MIESMVWSAVVVYGLWLAGHVVRELMAQRERLAASSDTRMTLQRMAKLERVRLKADARVSIATLAVPKPAQKRADIVLPDDLEAHVNSWGDEFARGDEREAMRAKYLELHTGNAAETWQRVRTAFGIGQMPP